jgi:tRNA pseudouridine38-40 synthase
VSGAELASASNSSATADDDATHTVAAPSSSSSPASNPRGAGSFESVDARRAFYAASTLARKERKQARHAARQAEQVAAKQARQKRDELEAVEWCRTSLQVEPAALALRQIGGQVREQRSNIVLQFVGTQYKGMQLQNRSQVPTIEGVLLHALYQAGGIDTALDVSLSHLRWMRTARTDGGVHAACNVVSCVLQYDEGLVQRVNTLLPRDIRVLSILPVADLSRLQEACAAAHRPSAASSSSSSSSASSVPIPDATAFALQTYGFHARESCTGRIYEYILPVAVLLGESQPQAADAASAASSAAAAIASPVGSVSPASSQVGSTPYAPLFAEPLPSAAPCFDLDSFHRARLSDADVARINCILQRFEGVKRSFHNFANPTEEELAFLIKRAQELNRHDKDGSDAAVSVVAVSADPQASSSRSAEPDFLRTVTRCCISELFEPAGSAGIQFARVRIEGKSFVFNQIRKMIGLATLVARGRVSESIFERAFEPRTLLDIPVAPSRGLLLRRPLFAHYDTACALTNQAELSLGRAFDALLQPDHEGPSFVCDVLEAEVCDPRGSHACFRTWLFTVHQQAIRQAKRGAGKGLTAPAAEADSAILAPAAASVAAVPADALGP